VGEIGLDFGSGQPDPALQLAVFSRQLAVARDLNRPVSIHIRKAFDPFIHLLKQQGPLPARGLIHSYSGSADMVPLFEKYNLYLSFSGAVTRPGAKKGIQALKATSPNRVLVETDSPDIAPWLSRGERPDLNQPCYLPVIVQIASQRAGIPFKTLATRVWDNACTLFDLPVKGA
jgi:TatD DNase family protein